MLAEIFFVLAKSGSRISAYSLLSGTSTDGELLNIGLVMNWPNIPFLLLQASALCKSSNLDQSVGEPSIHITYNKSPCTYAM